MRALYSAATGMMAQELNVQVISNNIANMRTTGYKRQQAHFQDLLYQTMRRAGATTSAQGTQTPSAIEIGSGVKAVSTARAMTQGNLTPTERDFEYFASRHAAHRLDKSWTLWTAAMPTRGPRMPRPTPETRRSPSRSRSPRSWCSCASMAPSRG